MKIAVASGKGGTGKTTVAVNLALAVEEQVCLADCDVEEPNGQLFLDVKNVTREPVCMPVPVISDRLCTACKTCVEFCEFNALALLGKEVMVFDHLCHGCGGCTRFCTEQAITEKEKEIGAVYSGTVDGIDFLYGKLNIGEVLAPWVIRSVQKGVPDSGLSILDSPPGTTCAMVQAVSGSDYCLIVAENTPFGFHDAKMAVQAVRQLGIPVGAVINRADIGSSELENFFQEEKIPVLLRIPFSEKIAELYSKGVPFVTEMPEYRRQFRQLAESVKQSA